MFLNKKSEGIKEYQVKEWFIIVNQLQCGPYSLSDLRKDGRFNPDTFVWKKGFKSWVKARFVLELKEVFKDTPKPKPLHEPYKIKNDFNQNQEVLTLKQFPHQFSFWVWLIIFVLLYTFFYLYH